MKPNEAQAIPEINEAPKQQGASSSPVEWLMVLIWTGLIWVIGRLLF